ncbi:hypothetical protein M3650_17980, partial [Paenibacillus sp. MER TA 81-3]|uniref:hypothetical protein n=1 Tax=Paenibacillus sp. MER TA 81-3 TaxID=2939573 RepID=UPI00203CD7C5
LREHRDHQPLMRYFDYTEKKRQTLQKNEELSLSGLRDFFSGLGETGEVFFMGVTFSSSFEQTHIVARPLAPFSHTVRKAGTR